MKSEEFIDEIASASDDAGELNRTPGTFTALAAIWRGVACGSAFALFGTFIVAILTEHHSTGDFLAAGAVGGCGGLLLLWAISGCGVNPFRDHRALLLERYVADSRRTLDSSELTIGAAQGIRAYLDILEQGARTLRRGPVDKGGIDALLKLQSECAAELRAVLNEIIAPAPHSSAAQHPATVREVLETTERLGSFLLAPLQLNLKTEIDPALRSFPLDSNTASPIVLAALRESIKTAEARSTIQVTVRETGSFRSRIAIRITWQARPFKDTEGFSAIDTRALAALLRPVKGGLAVQNLSGARRVLELTVPAVRG